MSDQLLEPDSNPPQTGLETTPSGSQTIDIAAQSAPAIAMDEIHQARRISTSTQRSVTANQQLQEFVNSHFQGIKENADRLKDEGLLSEEIWRALRDQNQMQIDATLIKQVANHLHTAGQNKKLTPQELFKLLDSQDTDLALVRNRTVPENNLFEATSEVKSALLKVTEFPNPDSIGRAHEKIKSYLEQSAGTSKEDALKRLDRALAVQGSSEMLEQFVRQYGLSATANHVVSYEVQKLAGVLTAAELKTVSSAFQHMKTGSMDPGKEESDRREVSRILDQIANDQVRTAKLGIPTGDPQVVAHTLANRVFDHNGGALLAQIFVRSSVAEITSGTSAISPTRSIEPSQSRSVDPVPVVEQVNLDKQRALILKEVQLAATQQANSDFSRSPATALDQRAVKITLHGILNRHPELQTDPEIQKAMLGAFQDGYQRQFQQQFDSMNFIQRGYYNFQRQWSENLVQIGNFFERTVEAARELPAKAAKLAGQVYDAAIGAGQAVYSWGEGVVKFLKDPETWTKLADGIAYTLKAATNPENWAWIGNKIVDGVSAAVNWASKLENWQNLGKTVLDFSVSAITSTASFIYQVATDPQKLWETTKAVAGFLYDMGKSLGINDMLWGTWKLVEGAGRMMVAPFQLGYSLATNGFMLLTGQQSFDQFTANIGQDFSNSYGKALSCLAEGTVAIKGAVLLIGELTGITDCVMCAYYLSQGNFAMAALHGGFALLSIGSIVATIATGGAAVGAVAAVATGRMTVMQGIKSVGKVALKEIAKEGLEKLGKETGELAMKNITQEVGTEFSEKLVKMTGVIVEDGVSELATQVAKLGREALVGKTALESVTKMFSEISYKHTTELLKELKVYEHVKSLTLDLLKAINDRPLKEIEERLVKMGMGEEAAKASAKALRKSLVRGVSDKEMSEILTKEITTEITESLTKEMEKPFKELFDKALRGELETEAGKRLAKEMNEKGIKLSQKEIDDLVEAGWKGCKEGVEKAVREVVERAVKDAFDEFRRRKRFSGFQFELPESRTHENKVTQLASTAREGEKLVAGKAPGARVFEVEKRKVVTRKNTTLLTEKTIEDETEVV